MSGYLVDSIDPWSIEVAQTFEKRALRDGADASDVFLGKRSVRLVVSAYGSTKGDFWDKAQDLLAAFSPTLALNADTAQLGFLPFDFFQPTADISTWPTSTYPNGIPLRMYLRPVSIAGQVMDRDTDGGIASLGLAKKFTIGLVARDPLKVAINGTSSTASSYTNKGDTPVYPFIYIAATTATGTWTGTLNGASWTVNVDGSIFTTGASATSNYWLLDCMANTLYGPSLNGGSSLSGEDFHEGTLPVRTTVHFLRRRMDALDANSTFPTLAPGANARTVGGSLSPTQFCEWRDAFQ